MTTIHKIGLSENYGPLICGTIGLMSRPDQLRDMKLLQCYYNNRLSKVIFVKAICLGV